MIKTSSKSRQITEIQSANHAVLAFVLESITDDTNYLTIIHYGGALAG